MILIQINIKVVYSFLQKYNTHIDMHHDIHLDN